MATPPFRSMPIENGYFSRPWVAWFSSIPTGLGGSASSDAASVSYVASPGLTAVNVQDALDQLNSQKQDQSARLTALSSSPLGTGYLKWTGAAFTTEMMPGGFVPYSGAVIDVDLNGHNITGNSDGALSTPGDDTAVPSQKAVKTYVPNAPLVGLSVGAGTVTSASTIVQAMGYLEYRVALNDAKTGFPGFGTTHVTAAYGDHSHSGMVTGSGTAGRIPYWSSASALADDERFYWDVTTRRVIINQSGAALPFDSYPGTGLHILGWESTTLNPCEPAITFVGYNDNANLRAYRCDGAPGAPTAVANGMPIMQLLGYVYDGSAWTSARAYFNFTTTENTAPGRHGTSFRAYLTRLGLSTTEEAWRVGETFQAGRGIVASGDETHNLESRPAFFANVYTYVNSTTTYTSRLTECRTTEGTPFSPFLAANVDFIYLSRGSAQLFNSIYIRLGAAGVGATLKFEYSTGTSTWATLTPVTDGTSNMTTDGLITFAAPTDWENGTVNAVSRSWVRISTTSTPGTPPTIKSMIPEKHPQFAAYANYSDSVAALEVLRNGYAQVGYGLNGITNAEISYLSGVTSSIQTQINATNTTASTMPSGRGTIGTTVSASPTGTSSTTGVMMGLAHSHTNQYSTRCIAIISGQMANDTINDGATVRIRWGTGAAPANGDALTGSALGIAQTHTAKVAADKSGFCLTVPLSSLTVGVARWFDVSLAAVTGGTATITGVTVTVLEI